MRRFAAFATTGALSLAICLAPAQQARAQAENAAVMAFDINLVSLVNSETVKSSGVDPAMMAPGGSSDIDPNDLKRVFGAVSAPKSLAVMQEPNPETLPVSFFMRAQFKSPELAKKAYDKLAEEGRMVTLQGKEYMRPPEGEPQSDSMLAHMMTPDTIQLGSDDYVLAGKTNVFTKDLLSTWKKMPKAAVKIALDLNGARHLIEEAKQNPIPAPAMPLVSMVDNSSAIRLAFDLSSDKLMWLTMTGKDSGSTGVLKAQFDGMLAMASGFGKQGLGQIPMPKVKQVAGKLLDAMKTTQDGNDISLVLPRPAGFEEAVQEVGKMIPMMMMGGAGGPGGPPPGADPFN